MSPQTSNKNKPWFIETYFPGIRRCKKDSFRIEKQIFKGKSDFQDIFIFESLGFGKILTLDGIIQFSQSDEFIYHEMIVHVPLITHQSPKRFLLVGGGDGGVIREASKHPLKEIQMVDIDRRVVELAQKYLGFVSKGAFKDKRLDLMFEDGRKVISRHKDYFDVIIVDSTDPVGPGKVLFEGPFYKDVYEALGKDGIAIFQLGPFLDFDLIIKPTAKKLSKFFKYLNPIRLPMPSYSCGSEYCFLMASKTVDPLKISQSQIMKRLNSRLGKKASSFKYYTPAVHQASLAMPKIWQLG